MKFLPRVFLSRAFGRLAGCRSPRWLARLSIALFHGLYPRIDLAEAARGKRSDYSSLQDFFTRQLAQGARPIGHSSMVAPSDGAFGESGEIRSGTVFQAKGVPYSVSDFLQDADMARELELGAFATIYLAPWNYHRVHHPVSGNLVGARHIPGDLWPVNRSAVEGIPGLFVRNERAWVAVRNSHGLAVAVMVGAYNVGSIRLSVCPELGRSLRGGWSPVQPDPVAAGDPLGVFELGSTVVVLVDRGMRKAAAGLAWPLAGASVRMGRSLPFPP
ncbi:MAG TPA: archaetidylserine decarboxylase [Fibrobacteria bacterium]|nr:archaetidylserine decarboxylase [Fibrobacteria bacterium]